MARSVTIAERLREFREASGMTIEQLAKRSGICADTIKGNLIGRRDPTAINLLRLCEALNVSADRFKGCVSASARYVGVAGKRAVA